ncbi:MAG TPA: hypothetical protein PLU10_13330, partial [Chitinophagaceae bacterium]|nr:hypothetical protein [Chitinophagaceae bacterium]
MIPVRHFFKSLACIILLCQVTSTSFAQILQASGGPIEEGLSYNVFSLDVINLPVSRLSNAYGLKAVHLNITHPYFENLECFLLSPDGFEVKLFTNAGGNGKDMINTILSDEGILNIQENKLCPYTGVYQPQDPLGAMNNFQG